jgi:hypothetical protein
MRVTVLMLALVAVTFSVEAVFAKTAVSAPQGQAANRWRYDFYAGRWWYWKRDAQWSYFDGRRWVDWGGAPPRPTASHGVSNRNPSRGTPSTLGYRAFGVYPFNYGGPSTAADSAPPAQAGSSVGPRVRSGFGADTIGGGSVGVGLETGSRSGDAGSGVGGGTVGGADVSGWNQRK